MTLTELKSILDQTGIYAAHLRLKTRRALPYIIYSEAYTIPIENDEFIVGEFSVYKIELYSENRDETLDAKIVSALSEAGITYEKRGQEVREQGYFQMIYEFKGVKQT